jgi:hypothetical protein
VRRRAVCRRGRQIHCAAPKQAAPTISFKFGETITHLAVQKSPAFDSVEVWGEGAASAKGADKAHWLSTDLSGVSAKACCHADGTVQAGKLGERPCACAKARCAPARPSRPSPRPGRPAWPRACCAAAWKCLPRPRCFPAISWRSPACPTATPPPVCSAGQVLHVRGVRHVLDRQRGALTRLTF